MAGMPSAHGGFVGRAAELDLARRAVGLGPDRQPGGRLVLSGEAGIGKSRLLDALAVQAAEAGWTVLAGHCVGQVGPAMTYLPFVEITGRVHAEDPQALEAVRHGHPSLAKLAPVPTERPASTDPAGPPAVADPGLVAEAVHALLNRLGAQRPTLVVVEDVHWADHSSRDLLTLLLTRGFSTAVSLVVTYRSDDLHRRHPLVDTLAVWARLAGVDSLSLTAMADRDIRELVAAMADGALQRHTVEAIVRRAEGNPFFAEELARSSSAGLSVGGDLSRVLRSRIEHLDPPAQDVVRAVAVGGRTVTHDLLVRVAEVTEPALDCALSQAVDRQVLVTSWPPAYRFRHALLGEAVLETLLPGQRMRLHRRYAAILAEVPSPATASELARHAAGGGDLSTATRASRVAAGRAMALGGPREALGHLERALDWMSEDDPQRDEVTLAAAEAARTAGDTLRAVELLRDRLEHPGASQSAAGRAELLAAFATTSRTLDMPVDRPAAVAEALRLVPPQEKGRVLRVLVAQVQVLVDLDRWSDASDVADRAIALADELGDLTALTEIRVVMVRVIEAMDDLDRAEGDLTALLAGLDRGDPIALRVIYQLAAFRHRRGDLVGALARFDEGAHLARTIHRPWAPWGLECRLRAGVVAYELGDWPAALQRLDTGAAVLPQPGQALVDATRLLVSAGRGDRPDSAALSALREWWPVDGLCIVLTATAGVDLLGHAGDVEGLLDLADEAVRGLDDVWGTYHAVVRLAALVAGQAAAAVGRLDGPLRQRLLDTVARLGARAAAVIDPPTGEPVTRRSVVDRAAGLDGLADTSRETWAWALRLRAEQLRVAWASERGTPGPELVEAWRASVAGFVRYGHVYETARSLARLAQAQQATGDRVGARESAARARHTAQALRARPLLDELDALTPPAVQSATASGAVLTPREVEVLRLIERGRSNGQIGTQLYISTKTVSVHVSNLLAKLGAASRTEAVALARDRGLLS